MDFFNDLADFSIAEIKDLIALSYRLNEKPEPTTKSLTVLGIDRTILNVTPGPHRASTEKLPGVLAQINLEHLFQH